MKHISDIYGEELDRLRRRAQSIRLVATDLDGTLFNQKHQLGEENRRALEKLADRGLVLVAATGRSRTSIPDDITSLPGVKYLITANGSKLYVNGTDEIIYEKYIEPDAIDYIGPFFSDNEVMLEAFWDGTPHVEEARYIAARDYGIPKWFSDYFFNSRVPIEDFGAAVQEHIHEIENVNFVFGNEAAQNRVHAFLKKRTDLYELTSSFPFNYEIGGIGVSKAAAVDFIAKREGVPPGQTLCFGDNDNDASMVTYAGIGIATANAVESTLAAADYITLDCENDGVAAALKIMGMV